MLPDYFVNHVPGLYRADASRGLVQTAVRRKRRRGRCSLFERPQHNQTSSQISRHRIERPLGARSVVLS